MIARAGFALRVALRWLVGVAWLVGAAWTMAYAFEGVRHSDGGRLAWCMISFACLVNGAYLLLAPVRRKP